MDIHKRRMRRPDGRWVTHEFKVYTREEADAHGIEYVYWKDVEEGDHLRWVIDDGGYVSQMVRAKKYRVGRDQKLLRLKVTLCWADFYENTRFKISWAERARWQRDWKAYEAQRSRSKRTAKAYARLYFERSGKLTPEDYHQLGVLYRGDQKNPTASFRRWLKISQVQGMVLKELSKILVGRGVTPDEIVRRYNEVYDGAIGEGQLAVAKSILDKFADMLDMKPDKTHVTGGIEQLDYDDFPELPEGLGDEVGEIAVTEYKRVAS